MSTAEEEIEETPVRVPLRLRMAKHEGRRGPLDGGWWPQSRNLEVELADLVDHFPSTSGRIVRATSSPPDWDDAPKRVPVRTGYIQVGFAAGDDTHVMLLRTSDRRELVILVIPSHLSEEQGEIALAGAATPNSSEGAVDLLARAAAS